MINLLDFEPWWRFGVALLIGAMLGMEREFIQQKEDTPDFAGLRTFSLIALLGAVAAFLVVDFGFIPVALSLGGLILLTDLPPLFGPLLMLNSLPETAPEQRSTPLELEACIQANYAA